MRKQPISIRTALATAAAVTAVGLLGWRFGDSGATSRLTGEEAANIRSKAILCATDVAYDYYKIRQEGTNDPYMFASVSAHNVGLVECLETKDKTVINMFVDNLDRNIRNRPAAP